MSGKRKKYLIVLLILASVAIASVYLSSHDIAVLQPKGIIAQKQLNLLVVSSLLSLIVVVPVFTMLTLISLKYRESNHKTHKIKYTPNWDGNKKIEIIWWVIPFVIIFVLSIITWNSSHDLDPFKPLNSRVKPVRIQVIALQWKWLFIYPEQKVATVNYVQFPVNTPVDFEITSDAPMNSFWIPQLAGQIYAMSGMSTQLHLMADKTGSYIGRSANISGSGFSGMTFSANTTSKEEFNSWVQNSGYNQNHLNLSSYNKLAAPSKNNRQTTYVLDEENIYTNVVEKYTSHHAQHHEEDQ
jgi:cytochrome o ubiquinol oxidase subunit 2